MSAPAIVLVVLAYAPADVAPPLRERVVASLRARGAAVVDHAVEAAIADREAGWRTLRELHFFAEGAQLMEQARKARERVELEEAQRLFGQATLLYVAFASKVGVRDLAAEASLERGVVLAELGRPIEARGEFRRAMHFSPGIQLTERFARPDVVRLFRDARLPQPPEPMMDEIEGDLLLAPLRTLARGATPEGVAAILDALGIDAAIVVVGGRDGRGLAVRAERGCSTQAIPLPPTGALDEATEALMSGPCRPGPLGLAVDDPRLHPAPVAAPAKQPRRPPRKVWPWAFGGALAVGVAVIGVTVGVVISDPRYAVRVDGRAFGAQ